MSKNYFFVSGIVFAALITLSVFTGRSAMAIEEPKFEKIAEYDEFEIRKYPPFLIAETLVEEDFDEAGKAAFKRLGGYIFGNNEKKDKIEMTAPVSTEPAGEADGKKRWRIHFVMPADRRMESLPIPNDSTVTRREVPGQIVAVHRFSGTWSEERFAEKAKFLLEEVRKNGLSPKEETLRYARYNPPFTPWFLRRNEVMVEIAFKTITQPVSQPEKTAPSGAPSEPNPKKKDRHSGVR